MERLKRLLKEFLISAGILAAAFLICLLMQNLFHTQSLIPAVFVLAVFLIALVTRGYAWGMLSSLVSVLAVNYAFTFPYFHFNFSVPESLLSAVIMLAVTVLTGMLTTKLKAQERIRAEGEREKMRANLLRAVSHDLRTPLTSIYGSCSAIMENYDRLSPERRRKLLGEIREDAEWLIQMVENLLSVTRIGGGQVNIIKTPTVLEELIDAVLIRFQKRYPGQMVEVSIPDEFVSIPMDAMLIEQVLTNLLENAEKHAEGMKRLWLSVTLSEGRAVFEVADDGCGIPRERLDGLFQGRPEKGEPASDGRRDNAGIGLSVCAAIIKAHGGDIYAGNRKGGGMIFGFSLELEEEESGEQI
jgi:two-component system sensor histidine kinase KdpD